MQASQNEQETQRDCTGIAFDLPKMVVKGWLSARTSFDVRIDGPFGAKEGATLLRLLAAQLEVLTEDEAERVNRAKAVVGAVGATLNILQDKS